jgi:hypothetical protein
MLNVAEVLYGRWCIRCPTMQMHRQFKIEPPGIVTLGTPNAILRSFSYVRELMCYTLGITKLFGEKLDSRTVVDAESRVG